MRLAVAIALLSVLILLVGCAPQVGAPEHEASANLDLGDVVPLLEGLEGLSTDPGSVASAISEMRIGDERELTLSFADGPDVRLVVYLDDTDAPDLYFFGTAEQAAYITQEVGSYWDE